MKKIIFIVLMSFMSFMGYSQLTEDFEGTSLPDTSGDWALTSGNWKVFDKEVAGTTRNWTATTVASQVYLGSRSAIVQREGLGNGNTSEEWLVTPRTLIRTNDELRFFTKQLLSGDQFTSYQVRVSTNADPLVKESYVTIKTYTEADLSDVYNVYNERRISFGTRAGQNLYIAFVKVYAQTTDIAAGDSWLIDNVNIVPECVAPAILQAPRLITAYSATLRWTGTGVSYEVEYGLPGFVLGEGIRATSTTLELPIGSTAPNQPQPGALTPGTRYEFYVRSTCADGSVSAWSLASFFDTLLLGSTCQYPKIVTTPLPYSDTSNTLLYGNNITNSSQGTACGVTGTGNYLASVDAVYAYTAEETGLISITMNPFGVASTGVFVYSSCAAIGSTCLAGVGNANGTVRTIPTLNVTQDQTYYIVVSSRDVTFNFDYLLLIQKVTCAPPTAGTATATGSQSANLAWTMPTGNTATAWQVAVQPAGQPIPTATSPLIGVSGTPSLTINNDNMDPDLTPGTNYQYWVRADCGNGTYSPWAGPFLFTTESCNTADKCNYTFTLTDTGADGWEGGRMLVRQNGVTVATLGATITGAGPTLVVVGLCPNIPFDLFWSASGTTPSEIRVSVKNRFDQIVYSMTTSSTALINTVLYSESAVDCINPRCLPPTGLTAPVVNITARSARLTWAAGTVPPQSWEIYVVQSGAAIPTAETPATYTSLTNSFDIPASPGLNPDTAYQFYVRAVCDATRTSVWSAAGAFTTLVTCPRPTALTATLIGTEVATLGWTNTGSTATSWQVFIQPSGLPAPGANATPSFIVNAMSVLVDTEYDLNPDTDYDFYVRGNCGDENGLSGWSVVKAFRTLATCPQPTVLTTPTILATSVRISFTNNSSATSHQVIALPCGTAAPTASTPLTEATTYTAPAGNPTTILITGLNPDTCYEFYVRSICGPNDLSRWTGPARATTQIAPPACGGVFVDPGGANANYTSNLDSTVIICPEQAGQIVTVTFTSFSTEPRYDALYVYDGNAVNAAQQISSTNGAGLGVNTATGAFWGTTSPGVFTSTTLDGCLTFRFRTDGSGNQAGWTANVSCTQAPTCRQPSRVTATNPQLHSVNLAWTNLNTTDNFQVIALPCGSPAPSATLPTTEGHLVTGTAYVYDNLLSATCYDFYVRAICSADDKSAWSRASSSTTLVAPAICGGNYVDTGGVAGDYGNSANSIVTICPTNPTDIVIVTFASFNTEEEFDGMYVYDGNTVASPPILSQNGVGQGPLTTPGAFWGTQIPGPFESSLAGGCLTFRFRSNAFDTAPGWVSHISCVPAPPCPKPRLLTATGITQTNANLGWTESGTATSWQIIVQQATLPAPSQDANGIPTGLGYTATNLTAGVTYNFYVRSICSSSEKSRWAGPFSFTTKPVNDECSAALFAIVNQNLNCVQTVRGSLLGATASTPTTTCGGGAVDDIWYTFIATSETHIVSFNNVSADVDLQYAVYRGACGSLTQQSCNAASNLTPGNTYYIRIFSGETTPQNVSFDLCIGTLPCTEAPAFCTGQVVTYENATGIPSLGTIGCLNTTPNPAFFFLQVNQAGPLTYSITQRDAAGGGLDVDYVAWGPFTDLAMACNAIPNNPLTGVIPAPSPAEGCPGRLHACSYDSQEDELMCIPNAQLCEVYVLMITNFSDDPGMITFTQTNTNGGTTACFPINTFNYPQTTYCQDGIDPLPVLSPGAAAGTYTASPVGLVIDPVTGTIDVSASLPGAYQVTSTTLTSTGGACTNIPSITTTRTVIITLSPNSVTNPTTITYATEANPTPVFCNSIRTAQPVIRTGATGGTFSLVAGETGLLVDPITGSIIPVTGSPGVYHIQYTVAANGGCPEFITTAAVTVVESPVLELPSTVKECVSYTLPPLTVGTYYTATGGPNGTGAVITEPITETQTVFIYADNGVCSSEESFEVRISPLPDTPTVTVTQPTCATTGGAEVTSPVGTAASTRSNLFISEVTDAATGSLTYVEIFNGTGASVNLANYKLKFFNNGNATVSANCDFPLVGTLANNAVYVVAVGSANNLGGVVPNQTVAACPGINNDDHIKLTTITNDPIDVWGVDNGVAFTPLNQPGYDYQRIVSSVAPSLTWNAAEWVAIDPEIYTNVGTYAVPPVVYVYEYSIDGGLTYQTSPTFPNLASGEHNIIVRNIDTRCVSAPFNFTINPSPASASVTTFSYTPATICQDATVTLTPDTSATGFTTGGTFTAVPSTGLIIDPATGVINGGSAPGTYVVTYSVLLDPALCQAAGSSDFTVTINNINATPVTTFTYAASVCQGTGTILPDTTAIGFTPGGTYTYDQASGLSLDPSTGAIDVDASTAGTYVVTYTITANPLVCQGGGSTSFTITILAGVPTVTTFSYTPAVICQDATVTLTPDTSATGFTTGGTFTAVPSTGLILDPSTGVINGGSTPGVYVVTYAIPLNAAICQAAGSTDFTVTINSINATPVTTFTYPTSTSPAAVCQGTGILLPDTTAAGFATGGTFTYDQTSGLSLDPSTGAIDTGSSTPGTYFVTYTITANPAICQGGGSTTVGITILATTPTVTTITYQTPVCLATGGTLAPDTTATGFTTGGTYTISPTTGLAIDAVTGVLTVTGATPGNYAITYAVPQIAGICQSAGQTTFNVVIRPTVNAVTGFGYNAAAYCGNVADPAPNPVLGFTTGGTYAATPAGLTIDPATGVIDLSASLVGTYNVSYTVNSDPANCFIGNTSPAVSVTVNGATTVVTGFSYPTSICAGDVNPSPTTATGFTTGGTFTATPPGLSINSVTGVIDLANSTTGVLYTVTYAIAEDATICRAFTSSVSTIIITDEVDASISGVCVSTDFVLTANHATAPGVIYQYQWLNSAGVVIGTAQTQVISASGQYAVNVIQNGCTSSANASFTSAELACSIQKGISPRGINGGDGKNDNFDLSGLGLSKLEIFNRYGTKVYSKNNYKDEWFGQSDKGDELPDGTYYYVLEYASGKQPETGWVYINREK